MAYISRYYTPINQLETNIAKGICYNATNHTLTVVTALLGYSQSQQSRMAHANK